MTQVLDERTDGSVGAARQLIAAYHKEQLRQLLERVGAGFARFDSGNLDVYELDGLIRRYTSCASRLWSFCGSNGEQRERAAQELEHLREIGEEPDWWESGDTRLEPATSSR